MTALGEVVRGRLPAVVAEPNGGHFVNQRVPAALLAGAFNPLHIGHIQLANVANELLRTEAHFELCIANLDKPPLSEFEIQARLEQFAGRHSVWVTRAATFAEKAMLFPGATFVVGADTAQRIVSPCYYEGSGGLDRALDQVRAQQCRFLVAGRCNAMGEFLELGDLAIPTRYSDLFVEIPRTLFRVDLSSTMLRATE